MTVEKIAWIVGVELGTMFESQDQWIKKIRGRDRIRRVYRARNIICMTLHELCSVSYTEISREVGNRHLSRIGRGIKQARQWRLEPGNGEVWGRIEEAVKLSIAAEKEFHAKEHNLVVSSSK